MNRKETRAVNGAICPGVNESRNEISMVNSCANRDASAMMKFYRTGKAIQLVLACGLLLAGIVPAHGQVLATQRAGFGLPANQVAAPNTPGGGVVVGSFFYATDQVNGFRHYLPADPANPDPVNAGILQYDNAFADGMSIGGEAPFLPLFQNPPDVA